MPKRLLIIESNTTGTGLLTLEKALAAGLSPLFLTNNPRRYQGLELIQCPVIVCDTNSVDALRQTIASHIEAEQILGITTTSEFYLETVAWLTSSYGLPGNAPEAIAVCRNKASTRQALAVAKIPQPAFAIIRSLDELREVLAQMQLPYVVKPADDTGSNEVRLCKTVDEVKAQTARIFALQTNVRGQQTAQTVLLEEFLDAPEFSVEMFSWRGTATCIGITQKHLTKLPYFVEQRHIFPAVLSQQTAEIVQETVRHALEVVGVTHGATHTEVKLTPRGVAIIEINARLAGGMIPELIRYATGIDLVEQQINAVVGTPLDLSSRRTGYAGIQFLLAHQEGWLKGIQGIETIQREIAGIEQVTVTALTGKRVAPPRSAYDRLGYVIAQGDTYGKVVQRLDQALTTLAVLVGPDVSDGIDKDETDEGRSR